MEPRRATVSGREVWRAGEEGPLLIQPVDDHDLEGLAEEVGLLRAAGAGPFRLAAFKVANWNDELSPWPAPAAFGDAAFGGGAGETLAWVEGELLPALGGGEAHVGGYSLAGLFALYAAFESDRFTGAAGVSPSVWLPGWPEYVEAHPLRASRVYLSLGDREERTRHPVLRTVGDNLRRTHELLTARGAEVALEWNPGNHFRDPARRTAKGFLYLLRN